MEQFLITLNSVLVTAIFGTNGYFLKKLFDKTDRLSDDISDMKPKVDFLWKKSVAPAHSPRQLNEVGTKILNESGIKELIDIEKTSLAEYVRKLNPRNAYDAENAILTIVNDIPRNFPHLIATLKDGAFRTGCDIEVLLLVGGIYLRNQIFPDLGFSIPSMDRLKSIE